MNNKRTLILLGIVCVVLLCVLGYSYLPQEKMVKTLSFKFLQPNSADSTLPGDLPRFLYDEERTLNITQPIKLWSGDSGTISLSITPNEQNGQKPELSNSATVYNISIETRLELENIDIQPGGTIVEPVHAGKPVQFLYTINPTNRGLVSGKLWVDVSILSAASGESWQVTRLAIPIDINISNYLGLSITWARIGAITLLGLALTCIILILLLRQPARRKSSR